MTFAPDTEVSLTAAAWLVNTGLRRDGVDALATVGDLDRFYADFGYAGRHDRDDDEVAAVRGVRDRLHRLWEVDRDEAAALVNEMLREAGALPYLVRHDGWDWHLHATSPEAPLADRMAVDAAMALVDVVRQGELGRLKVCAADDCDDVLVDLSRNSSKRYCSTTCANRVNMAAFRSRHATPGTEA